MDMTNTNTGCSCGERGAHVVARRETADGIAVQIWHDGAVTGRYGRALPGVPVARPRTTDAIERERAASNLIADEISLFGLSELPRLYACARRVAANGGGRSEMLAALSPVEIEWETYQAGRDGKPIVRVARFDDLRLAVWHECGTYTVHAIVRSGFPGCAHIEDVLHPTGFSFSTQAALVAHIREQRALNTQDGK
jgi:hypothetical protein